MRSAVLAGGEIAWLEAGASAGPALVHTVCVEGRLPPRLQRLDLGDDFASIPFFVLYRPSVMERAPTRFILEEFATQGADLYFPVTPN